jgi:hypothetical protein
LYVGLPESLIDLRARKAGTVSVEMDVETVGWPRAVEVHAVDVDRLQIPSFASGNDEVVGQFVIKRIIRAFEVLRRGGIGSGVIVLVVKNHLRSVRRWQYSNFRETGDAGSRGRPNHGPGLRPRLLLDA